MKVSVNWIKEYMPDFPVNDQVDAQKVADRLALTSTEVAENGYQIPQSSNLVVGKVLEIRTIENSSHLKIAIVNAGKKDYQIVTGAPNIEKNQLVVLALPGALLPNGKKIEATTLDGEISQGMLVSLQEIGFDDSIAPKKHEAGIYVFPKDNDVKVGDDAVKALGIDDLMIDTELTANRGDMLSIRGNLYEFSALLEKEFKLPSLDLQESSKLSKSQISVNVDPKLADRYYLRIINNVKVEESPLWLQRRLWNSGLRPINNLVDVTNYVMLLFGQPMHAFDLNKLEHKNIRVALSKDEKFKTLDGKTHQLKDGEDIVVYDDEEPQMLAGVMGGTKSEVTEKTRDVVLESAVFNPILVRKTARRFNLHSQASQRFERGIDISNCKNALNFAAALLQEVAGGEIAKGIIAGLDDQSSDKKIKISLSDINNYLGTDVKLAEVENIWQRLNFEYDLSGEEFVVSIPKRRPDITIKADLIEEFVRIYGYEKVPARLPQTVNKQSGLTVDEKLDRAIKNVLLGLGLNQAISYSLTDPEAAGTFTLGKGDEVSLSHPMSQEHSVMRQSILSTLLQAASYNAVREADDIRLFESGTVFFKQNGVQLPKEDHQVAGLISGVPNSNWQHNQKKYDFYYIKGILESFLSSLALKSIISYQASDQHKEMHPGRTADVYVGDHYLGFVGQINPKISKKYKMNSVFVFQIDSDLVHELYKMNQDYTPLDKFPGTERDLSLLVDKKIESAEIERVIKANAGNYLRKLQVIDLYQGKELGEDKKSISYRLDFVNTQATITDAQVNQSIKRIEGELTKQLSIMVR
ncbi:phenylalanine--tRNA ligase subunit beta [Oenococcus oeni]|uniref:phenylalanine--tRNA ligase subunit beta n=1 Tax=Oenococcus oeni TaxID=1247 RepID=UPI00050F9B5A|nr:phenylalanine--tRNA ligase subunit beta [Oenococcus oeni]KGH96313.1 phenylalanyl-tRNA synthetase subunit beta [Oenococcus oeni IOEB_S450]